MSPWNPRSRIVIFVSLTYLLMGAAAAVLVATDGLAGSRVLIPGTPITVAAVLLPTAYMFSPAVAHVLTRLMPPRGGPGLGCGRVSTGGEGWCGWWPCCFPRG